MRLKRLKYGDDWASLGVSVLPRSSAQAVRTDNRQESGNDQSGYQSRRIAFHRLASFTESDPTCGSWRHVCAIAVHWLLGDSAGDEPVADSPTSRKIKSSPWTGLRQGLSIV